ncbi:O-acetylhomoserine/O-acetylserine sulfhydrylase-like pyridoxal-dependent enzyme [Bacillus fengqiuensis]|nr:O-acetylhomoserine/O-acetylserine sulfhydrylase-like pyridoxal-dependent enzyme [Bacillus fengqiuensis]
MNQVLMSGVKKYAEKGEQMVQHEKKRRQEMRQKKFDTIAVHGLYGLQEALENQGSIMEPTFLSSAQHFENSDHLEAGLAYLMPAWGYTRIANPTVYYLEQTLSLLEGYGYAGETGAVATSSGMAAIFMATNPFLQDQEQGTNFVSSAKTYGGTFMLFNQRYGAERGVDVRWVKDALNIEEWAEKIDKKTRFIYVEMPSNPGLSVSDIEKLADLAHDNGIPLIVDSTLTTPAIMRPICHGADIVVHSLSKAIAAGGSAIAGAIIARENITSRVGTDEMRENFAAYVKLLPQRDHGTGISPMNAHLVLNDLRNLRSRIDVMSKSAMKVAEFLSEHSNVEVVGYPGLPSNEGYEISKKYMWLVDGEEDYGKPVNRFGYMLSFNVKGGAQAARDVFDKFNMIYRATDLGRVKTVATIPAISTHQQQGEEGRELASLPSNLIRLSVGMEHPIDIINDLEQALKAAK